MKWPASRTVLQNGLGPPYLSPPSSRDELQFIFSGEEHEIQVPRVYNVGRATWEGDEISTQTQQLGLRPVYLCSLVAIN